MRNQPHELFENFLQKHLPHQKVIASGPHTTDIENEPGIEFCDFCNFSAPSIPNTFEANSITVDTVVVDADAEHNVYESLGDWAACDPCAALIRANNRDGLLQYALKRAYGRWDKEVPPHKREEVRQMLRFAIKTAHDAFFASRK